MCSERMRRFMDPRSEVMSTRTEYGFVSNSGALLSEFDAFVCEGSFSLISFYFPNGHDDKTRIVLAMIEFVDSHIYNRVIAMCLGLDCFIANPRRSKASCSSLSVLPCPFLISQYSTRALNGSSSHTFLFR